MQKIKIQLAPGLWATRQGETTNSNLAQEFNIYEAQARLKELRQSKPYPTARYSGALNWTP